MLRRCILCLSALLIVMHSGCAQFGGLAGDYDSDKYEDAYSDRWGYTRLNAEGKELYGALYTAVTDTFDTDSTVTIPDEENPDNQVVTYGVEVPLPHPIPVTDTARLEQINTCFQYDNPQFFHLCSTRYVTSTGRIGGKEYYTSLTLLFTHSVTERVAAKAELEAAVTGILSERPDTTDQYLTELYLHDRLTALCTYDDAAAQGGRHDDPNARNAYGALVEGTAICGGYTKAMTLLLQRCGIASTHIISRDGEHVWNLVEINGRYYHLDATWNDTDDCGYHLYFNCSTDELTSKHLIGEDQNNLPLCDATQDNYYRRTGIYANVRDSEVLAEKIADAVKQGDDVIEIFTRPEAYEYCLLFLKNQAKTFEQVNPYLADSGQTMWDYALYSMQDEHKLFLHKTT